MAHKVSPEALARLQAQPSNIRNICILAHVDHGKTTLTDCLISSNGIISQKLAGKVRYMDSTEEEQLRGITMKSSAISLLHSDEPFRELRAKRAAAVAAAAAAAAEAGGDAAAAPAAAPTTNNKVPYLVNLIDSPGHVDFSMDVATAARLCDGALVVVDAVEGVCIQTHAVLRTAWAEGVRPVLLINKLDRLITELQLSPPEAYSHLCRILEQANAILSELYMADLMAGVLSSAASASSSAAATAAAAAAAAASGTATGSGTGGEEELTADEGAAAAAAGTDAGASGGDVHTFDATGVDVDERAEAALFFDPTKGNVIFASAVDGWAFTLDDFAGLHCGKLELPRSLVRRALWGDYYYKPKAKKIVTGSAAAAAAAKGKPLAVSLVWERLWAVYEAVLMAPDEARAAKIIAALALDVPKRDLAVKDAKLRLQAIMRTWLPVAPTVLGVVARKLPSPVEAQAARVAKLWPQTLALAEGADGAGGGGGDATAAVAPTGGAIPPAVPGMSLAARLARVRACIAACDPSPDAECVVYVSKMFAVPKASLPDLDAAFAGASGGGAEGAAGFPSRVRPTPESAWYGMGPVETDAGGARAALDLSPVNGSAARGRALHRKQQQRKAAAGGGDGDDAAAAAAAAAAEAEDGVAAADDDEDDAAAADGAAGSAETLIAFARVFSGVLRPDSPVFVLGPKYAPSAPSAGGCAHISQVGGPVPIYMMMGRELSPLLEARAGNVVGLGRLAGHVLKTATLASTPACVSLSPMTFQTTPLVRVAVEPKEPRHLGALERGLALLNQADPCVEVSVSDATGELQLSALGELHLDRCIRDLVTRFARCEVTVSPPILAFQETLAEAPRPVQPPAAVLAALGPAGAAAVGGLGSPTATAGSGGGGGGGSAQAASSLLALTGSSGGGGRWSFPSPPLVDEPAASPSSQSGVGGGDGEQQQPGSSQQQHQLSVLTAGFEFGHVYGGATLPWSWTVPQAGVAYHPPSASVVAHTPDRTVALRLRAVPMPQPLTRLLQDSAGVLKAVAAEQKRRANAGDSGVAGAAASAAASPAVTRLFARLSDACDEAGGVWPAYLRGAWALGPKRVGPNMLVGRLDDRNVASLAAALRVGEADVEAALTASLWQTVGVRTGGATAADGGAAAAAAASAGADDGSTSLSSLPTSSAAAGGGGGSTGALTALRSSIVQGFQLAAAAGPLCGEPLWGVAFVVEEVEVRPPVAATAAAADADGADGTPPPAPPSSAGFALPAGQVMAVTRDACRLAFQAGEQRLVEAVYQCELQCSGGRGGGGSGEQLGRLYGVLARRRGRVISEDVREGTATFEISAHLPVVESFGFADDLRKQTSGAATSPQLVFSHWEVLEADPFFRPQSAQEREEFGDTLHEGQGGRNLARGYVDAVRGRKGMPVERKIVAHAEKQRTLSRKK